MSSFDRSVFINCPLDESYSILLQSMLFTIISLGFEPRIAIESTDAGVNRLDKIIDLITTSKVSVHDLSRIRSKKSGEYFRLNMPFELGIDFGCKKYSQACEFSDKKFLILGSKKYEYMRALSDISGFDIQYHHDDTKALIKAIRNWFVNNLDLKNTPSYHILWYKWTDFCLYYARHELVCDYSQDEIFDVPINEQIDIIKEFLAG